MATRYSIEAIYKAIDQFTSPLNRMTGSQKKFSRALKTDFALAQRQVLHFTESLKHYAKYAAFAGIGALGTGIAFTVKKASELENALVGYTTLLKGNEKDAKNLVQQLQILGAQTPFEFKDLSDATTMLMGFGAITKENAVPTLRMLGDLSQGSAEKLQGIALAYGQIKAAGRADMMDVRQLINNQVPILDALAKQWGVTVGEARKMIKTKGTFAEIEKAMKTMTSQGGLFYNGMLRASKTLTGLWSTFKDAIGMTAAGFGEALLPYIKEGIVYITEIASKALEWVIANKELIKTKLDLWIGRIVGFVKIAWKIFSFLYKVLKPFLPIILGIIIAWKAYRAIMFIAAAAQMLLNIAMTANPIGLIITAIGILIGLLYLLVTHWKQVTAFTQKWWDVLKGLLIFLGPVTATLMFLIEIIRSIKKHWADITEAFKSEGILGGIIAIGKAILDGVLAPIESLFMLLGKIPGVGKIFKDWGLGVADFRAGLFPGQEKSKTNENQKTQSPISPEQRSSYYNYSEKKTTNELVIKDETGKAELKKKPQYNNYNIKLKHSGAF